MTAEEFLSQAWEIDKRIGSRIEERDRLLGMLGAGRISRLTGMPRGGAHDWTDAAANLVDMSREIDADVKRLCEIKRAVNAAIDAITDGKCRRVLELRYRNYWTWERIAEELGCDLRTVYRRHDRGLLCVVVPEEFA